MTQCVICHRRVSRGFAYFCRGCYHDVKRQFGISDADFLAYINRSFKTRCVYPREWTPQWAMPSASPSAGHDAPRGTFFMVHERLKQRYPSIKPLAVILESILFLKMILRLRRKLKLCNVF